MKTNDFIRFLKVLATNTFKGSRRYYIWIAVLAGLALGWISAWIGLRWAARAKWVILAAFPVGAICLLGAWWFHRQSRTARR